MGLESLLGLAAGASPIGIGLGIAGSIGKFLLGNKQNKLANQINPVYDVYKGSSAVNQNIGAVQNAYNGRMAGAASAQENLLRAQQNAFANASRGATDASQLLALGAAGQGQTDAGINSLATAEGQNKAGLLDNLQAAYGQKIQDDRAINQSQLQKYQIDSEAKGALRSSGINNMFGAVNDASSMALQLGQLGGIGGGAGQGLIGGNNLGQQSLQSVLQNSRAGQTPQTLSYRNSLLGQNG